MMHFISKVFDLIMSILKVFVFYAYSISTTHALINFSFLLLKVFAVWMSLVLYTNWLKKLVREDVALYDATHVR